MPRALLLTAVALTVRGSASPAPSLAVRWAAPFLAGGGYSSEAISMIQGLLADVNERAGDDGSLELVLSIVPSHGDTPSPSFLRGLPPSTREALSALDRPAPPRVPLVSICHSEPGAWHLPPLLPRRYSTATCPEPGASYRIGRTMFESDRLPDGWAARLNAMDEVWVPTAFTRDAFAAGGVDASRLVIVGEAVDAEGAFSPAFASASASVQQQRARYLPPRACAPGERHGSSASCPFRFLSVGKWERRKGFDVLLSAFLNEFDSPHFFVELVILSSSYHSSDEVLTAVDTMITNELLCGTAAANVTVATGGLCVTHAQSALRASIHVLSAISQSDLPGLFLSCDAVVQASRGEGWGRPHVEALALALPLIATLWSGPSAFLTEANSFPLRHTHLAPIPTGAFAGHFQAEPDGIALAALMRYVVDHPDEARARGAVGRADMLARFTPRVLAAEVRGHFERIAALLRAQRLETAGEL